MVATNECQNWGREGNLHMHSELFLEKSPPKPSGKEARFCF